MSLRIADWAGRTDVGRHRQSNEDNYMAAPPLFVVADGMGGARAGEVASEMAIAAFREGADLGSSPERMLAETTQAANRRIHDLARTDETRAGMGTTLTAAVLSHDEVATGHVGDSRLYRLRDGRLERLTTDHSLVEELVSRGQLTPEAAETHPQRSVITRALGPEPDVQVDTFTAPGRDGDVYLLCSDGLTGMVDEQRVGDILRASDTLERAADALVDAANEGGGRDNITVVLFRLGEDEGAQDGEAETLSGRATEVGLHAADVRAAAAAEGERGSSGQETMVLSPPGRAPETRPARELRAGAPRESGARTRPPPRPARRSPLRGLRRGAGPLLALGAVAALLAAAWVASRQAYFLGTDGTGLVTLYRGLPYEGPFGLRLYEQEAAGTVPASTLDPGRRSTLLDHRLRDRSNAVGVLADLEAGRLE